MVSGGSASRAFKVPRDESLERILIGSDAKKWKRISDIPQQNLSKGAVDLHMHSTASDGLLSPMELLTKYWISNGKKIAFTDHDSLSASHAVVEHYTDFLESNYRSFPRILDLLSDVYGGVEMSTGWEGKEIHVKALGFTGIHDEGVYEEFINSMNQSKARKRIARFNDMQEINSMLYEDGLQPVKKKEVFMLTSKKKPFILEAEEEHYVGSSVIAEIAALKNDMDIEEVFQKYVKKVDSMSWEAPPIGEMVAYAKNLGMTAVLAHPGRYNLNMKELDALVRESRVDGIEVFYRNHKDSQANLFSLYADKNNLLKCVGSDFHGRIGKDQFGVKNNGECVTEHHEEVKPILDAIDKKSLDYLFLNNL